MSHMETITALGDEVVDALRKLNIAERFAEEQQLEREAERNAILSRLAEQEAEDEVLGQQLAADAEKIKRRGVEAEGRAAIARRELAELQARQASLGSTAVKLAGKLRRLADPRIGEAQAELGNMFDRVRNAFRVTTRTRPALKSSQSIIEEFSNGDSIADLLGKIVTARKRLEEMKEEPRPDDLPNALAGIVNPVRDSVRKLLGV